MSEKNFEIKYGGLASLPESQNNTLPVKNRPFSVNNLYFQDFTPLQAILPHSSALEPCLSIPKVLKSMKDLNISQTNEQKAATINAIIKDSTQENPKIQRKIIKPIQPEAIFNFTKFFYLATEKETASAVQKTEKTLFTSIPSIRFLSYEKHPPPINDFSQLDSLNRNGQPTTNPTTQAISQFQRSAPFSESTHNKSYEHPIPSTEMKKPDPPFQKIFPDHSNQKQAPTKPFATSRYNKQNNKSSRYNHTNSNGNDQFQRSAPNCWNALNESSSSSDDDQSSESPKSSLQALNQISKRAQWIKSDATPTNSQIQRPIPFSEPTTTSTRYKKQNSRAAHLKAYNDTQTKSHYTKKSHYQHTSSKILLKKESRFPNSEVNLQPHEEIKHEDFPPLPNSRRQSQHQIDGHQTTQQLILELLNKYNL